IVFKPEFRDFEVTARVAKMIAAGELEKFKQLLLG
ncbi:MAG: hypothetical protein QG639_900, partial [Patescibacteria group bacterium]|nr:hypothetical protein [Patescibacteria group bacterium]